LAARGHTVIGVDTNREKIRTVAAGRTPVLEDGLQALLEDQLTSGRFSATTDAGVAVARTTLALICVGTPSTSTGSLATDSLEQVAGEIGLALASRKDRYTVVIRSTVLPSTSENVIQPRLEAASGKRAGEGFGLAVNPEFLREGSSVRDFFDPPKTVIGEIDAASGDEVADLYESLPGPVYRVPLRVAEMTKYVDNSFHALKVGFANEIGALCKTVGVDSHEVMSIFTRDTKLNISPAYLRPGYAFGGSCLPKDLRAIAHHARHADLPIPILDSILPSNESQIQRVFKMVEATGMHRIGLFGLSFKAGTDDLRESPLVVLAERLVGRGFDLLIYDSHVTLSNLLGANRAYVSARIPHLSRLLISSVETVVDHAEVLIVGTTDPAVASATTQATDRVVIDLVRFSGSDTLHGQDSYIGVAW